MEILDKILIAVVPAVVVGLFTYLFTRPKQRAEVIGLRASTDNTYYTMAKEMQERLPVWIERYEAEKEEKMELQSGMRFATQELKRLQQELDACVGDRTNCREVMTEVKSLFLKIETDLAGFNQHRGLLTDLKEFKKRLENG
jgi:hypothetical protein